MKMDITKVNGYTSGFGDIAGSMSNTLGKILSWTFTLRNIVFIVIVLGIGFVCYKLYEQETLRKRYYFNRKREV